MNLKRTPHIVLVSPFPELSLHVSVVAFVRHLESRRIPVTIFVPGKPEKAFDEPNSEWLQIYGYYPNWHTHGAWRILSTETYIHLFALRKWIRQGWTTMIALNGLGLGNVQLLNRWLGLPVWYWSLEILFDDELASGSSPFCRWRQMEKKYLSSCVGGLIQDETKADAFRKENPCFQGKPMLTLPSSYMGNARRNKCWLLHDHFKLSHDIKIALYAGSFSASNGVDDIALSVKDWPENWVLVIHPRHPIGSDGALFFAANLLLKVCSKNRVFFSSVPKALKEYKTILDSADIGIAFYVPEETNVLSMRNNRLMGHSSGKVNSYVQAGLPVIVNDYTNMSEWVASSGCGKVVQRPDQIGAAIREMEGDLEGYSRRGIDYFNEHLRIDDRMKEVADRILGLRGERKT